ncbi:transglycosylase [Mycobacterium parmense]|nr:transglycosylase [Mycobacterium parmense]
MTDPFMAQAVKALTRGHSLFAGNVGQSVVDTSAQTRARATGHLSSQLHEAAEADRALAQLVTAARTDHGRASAATRALLQAAKAEVEAPSAATPLGRREAAARMAARLRSAHRHIAASRARARILALRLRRLHYPPPTRSGRPAVLAAIGKALDIKGIHDPVARARWVRGMDLVARRESSYHADALNPAAGQPSVGAWQFIAPTFAAFHQPGTSSDIHNLVAQACAFINYARGRYGVAADASDLADRIQQADPRRAPKGY